MTSRPIFVAACVLLACGSALAGPPAASFSKKPTATRDGEKVKISFAVASPTDVEVAILDATGQVVRHLAAGVLGGKNAPPEPLAAGLNQELTWNGKTDLGKAIDLAKAAPFTVRVRAGAGVKFGRYLGDNPNVFGGINSIACDEAGNLYAMGSDAQSLAPGTDCLRVFSPEGAYLRTAIPFPADLSPEAAAGAARWDESAKCFRPINLVCGNPAFYPWRGGARLASASAKGGIVLTFGTSVYRLDSAGGNLKGPLPMWPKGKGLSNPGWNIPQLAVSSDGKFIYYSNVANTKYEANVHPSKLDPKWPQGRVYRQDTTHAGEDPQPFYDLVLPDYDKQKYWLPDAWNKRTAAYGICLDAKDQLYVCDLVNQEIVEVSPDGKKVSATKAAWPERVAVDAKTGDYFVVSRLGPPRDGYTGKKLVKITGRGDTAKTVAELPLTGSVGESFALGTASGKAVMGLAGGGDILCVRDSGTAFEAVQTNFKPNPDAQSGFCRIAADYDRDEIYTNNGGGLSYRYDGKTGQGGMLKKNGQPFHCVDMAVGYDGSLYLRTGNSFTGPLERYTHNLDPLPFATETHQLWDIYSRMGIGFCDKGVGAGPNGESYISYMYGWNKYFVAGFGGDGKPIKGKFLQGKLPKPDAKSWVAKWPEDRQVTSAVVGPIPMSSGGILVDLAGNIYVGMRVLPKGFKPPAGFEKDPAYLTWSGIIAKFPPSGGTVLGAVKEDDAAGADGPRIDCAGGATVVGAVAAYPGIGPFSGGGWGSGSSDCCVCRVPRFGLDRFSRLVVPNAVTNSVTMLDNAGNVVLEFGAYGNFDSGYVNPNTEPGRAGKPAVAGPEFPLAWPTGAVITAASIYVNDLYNRRVLRADLTSQAEETCPVK